MSAGTRVCACCVCAIVPARLCVTETETEREYTPTLTTHIKGLTRQKRVIL